MHAGAVYRDGRTRWFRINRSSIWATLKPQHRMVTSPRPNKAKEGRVVLQKPERTALTLGSADLSRGKHLTLGE